MSSEKIPGSRPNSPMETGYMETVAIRIPKVSLFRVLNPQGEKVKRWERKWNTPIEVDPIAEPELLNQTLNPLPGVGFREYQKKYIDQGRADLAWEETLATVLAEMLTNAVEGREKEFDRKKPHVRMRTQKRDDDSYVVEISDDGEGIPQATLDAVREAKSGKIISPKGTGGGRGLIVAEEITKQLGGSFEVETITKENVMEGQQSGTTIRLIFSPSLSQENAN